LNFYFNKIFSIFTDKIRMEKDQASPSDPSDSQPSKNIISRFLDILGLSRSPDTTEDLEMEIQELLEEGEEQGLITRQEGQMINSIFEFRDTLVHEIMTPRRHSAGASQPHTKGT